MLSGGGIRSEEKLKEISGMKGPDGGQ